MTEVTTIGTYNCPSCESAERVFDFAHKELERRGIHEPVELYFHSREARPLQDVSKAILTMPTVVLYWDFCKGCGLKYVFRVDTLDAPIQYMQQAQRKPHQGN